MNQPSNESAGQRSTREIDGLTAHHLQSTLFRPLSEEEHARLVQDIRAHGVLQPIEITADGTIIDGHERVRAAQVLGLPEIPVRVRDDLVDQTAIDRRHAEANLNRRQLDPLDRARLALHLFRLEKGRRKIREFDLDDLRDRIGAVLGMGGRNFQRYLNLAQAPLEVQHAYSASQISLTVASRVCKLPYSIRERLVQELREGGNPAIVVKRYLEQSSRPTVAANSGKILARAASSIDAALNQLRQVAAPAERGRTPGSRRVRGLIRGLERHHSELVALSQSSKASIATAIKLELLAADRGCDDAR
jgi:ParB-like chromosome segregation protein Spo0J